MHQIKPSLKKQRGAASLIFVLLVALVITASTNEAVKSIRNSQEIGTAVNAASHAQTGLWVGAEAMRLYLKSLDEFSIDSLGGPSQAILPIVMDAAYGSVTADIISSTAITAHENYQVDVLLVNKHAASKSSAKLRVVYNVTYTDQTTAADPPTPAVQFAGGLNVQGDINLSNGGEPIDLTVDGDVTLSGLSVNPISSINSTGKVTIKNSSIVVDSIYADDDVLLESTTVQTVRTLGTLKTSGSASVVDTIANGDVTIKSTGRFDEISTQKNIYVNSGGADLGVIIAGENIEASQADYIDSANAVGDIKFSNWFDVEYATAMGDITCLKTGWDHTITLSANGSLIDCPADGTESDIGTGNTITTISGASNVVVPHAELTPRTLPKPDIDVWDLIDTVNYFVEYEAAPQRFKVTVNNVKNLPNGVYYIGKYNTNPKHMDYLCTAVDSNKNCTAPTTPLLPICFGSSLNNSCIEYENWSNFIRINPNTTAPGIIFFDGDVKLMNGHGMTTILASGDIKTEGNFDNWAPNRGGYEKVCEANADHRMNSGVKTKYTETYSNYYPTNLCDVANGEYTPLSVGNVALMAGGVNPDTITVDNPDGVYTGGDIALTSSTEIWGAVLAGNFLLANWSDVTVHGLVNAGAQGDSSTGPNSLTGSTTIDLQATDDYDPLDLPTVPDTPAPNIVTVTESKITWSRPL